jgi:hypothetical protein
MDVPKSAKICPYCRKRLVTHPLTLTIAIIIGISISVTVFQNLTNSSKIPPPTVETTDNYREVQGIVVKGKSITVGDKFDDVAAILHPADMLSQQITPDTKIPGSHFLIKKFDVDGKKFKLHVARTEDPGPYRVIGIEVK